MIFKDVMHLQIVCWHSLVTILRLYVNTQFNELSIHSQMNAQTITMYAMSHPPELNSFSFIRSFRL
jgi:hypothetical protein